MATGDGQTEAERAVSRARQAASQARLAAATRAYRGTPVRELFALPIRDCVYQCAGRPISLLLAGYLTSLDELGLPQLRAAGFDLAMLTVDEEDPRWPAPPGQAVTGEAASGRDRMVVTGEATAGRDRCDEVVRADLRTIPLPPRSFDIVHCALLLDRISHVELILDRFTAALRPGGLFLLRIRDRDCAAGLLDRIAPQWVRRALWARVNPGQPGPFRAVYSPAGSDRGIQAYMRMRGLVICQRETARTWPAGPGGAGPGGAGRATGAGAAIRVAAAARRLIARLTRDRLTDAHDEVLYVIRKPQDRFARVV
jgi:SAM-dependent methyltransferase